MNLLILLAASLAQDPPKEGLASKELAEAKDLIKQYFAARPADRGAILEKIGAIDHPSKSDIATLAKLCLDLSRRGDKADPKKTDQKCTNPDTPGSYVLRIPSGRGPYGVFIVLHGRGGSGDKIAPLFGTPDPNVLMVFPTVLDASEPAGWNTSKSETFVLSILEDVKRAFTVDTNRVYLAGFSMGGYGTWAIGLKHADLFASMSPEAGDNLTPEALPNALNTPIYLYHGRQDTVVKPDGDIKSAEELGKLKDKYGPFEFVWKLAEGVAHQPPADMKAVLDWVLKKTRNPAPRHVLWKGAAGKDSFYWLMRRKPGGLVEAKVDKNTIEITGDAEGLELMLSDDLVKLKDAVVVRVEGKEVFNAKLKYSIAALVESAARNDPASIFVARIKL